MLTFLNASLCGDTYYTHINIIQKSWTIVFIIVLVPFVRNNLKENKIQNKWKVVDGK